MTSRPELKNFCQATVNQLSRWKFITEDKGDRLISGQMKTGILEVYYKTQTGYYVSATFNQFGQEIKREYYHSWDPNNQEPVRPVFPEEMINV